MNRGDADSDTKALCIRTCHVLARSEGHPEYGNIPSTTVRSELWRVGEHALDSARWISDILELVVNQITGHTTRQSGISESLNMPNSLSRCIERSIEWKDMKGG